MIVPRSMLLSTLCFLHGTMRASENLLANAIAHSRGQLKIYFDKHLAEETGHVKMLEHDLERLGVRRILEFPAAAQLAGAQYYYIQHEHPALLLGYMAALESNGLNPEQVDELEAQHGPLTCSRHHATHDPGHSAQLREQIAKLAPDLRERVLDNEAWTVRDYRERIVPMIHMAAKHFEAGTL